MLYTCNRPLARTPGPGLQRTRTATASKQPAIPSSRCSHRGLLWMPAPFAIHAAPERSVCARRTLQAGFPSFRIKAWTHRPLDSYAGPPPPSPPRLFALSLGGAGLLPCLLFSVRVNGVGNAGDHQQDAAPGEDIPEILVKLPGGDEVVNTPAGHWSPLGVSEERQTASPQPRSLAGKTFAPFVGLAEPNLRQLRSRLAWYATVTPAQTNTIPGFGSRPSGATLKEPTQLARHSDPSARWPLCCSS